jgi:hypothetical protein
MGSTASSAVTTGDLVTAAQYNNLRLDVITNHDHDGTHGASVAGSTVITFASGATITAGSYQIGRDADSTNQLHFNSPNGTTMEWSINDVAEMTLSATTLDLNGNHLDNSGYLILNAVTNPGNTEVYVSHDNTGDITLNALSGKTINLAIAGTDEATMSASALNLTSGNTYQIDGADVITGSALGTGMQADQAAIEGQTNENTYVPPDLMHHHPGVAKAWCYISAAGTLGSPDYGVASVDDNGTGDRDVNYDTAFSSSVYSAIANNAHGSSNIARNVNVSLTTGDCSIFINDAESNAASDQNNCFVAFGDH